MPYWICFNLHSAMMLQEIPLAVLNDAVCSLKLCCKWLIANCQENILNLGFCFCWWSNTSGACTFTDTLMLKCLVPYTYGTGSWMVNALPRKHEQFYWICTEIENVIPPHSEHTGSWNSSSSKTRTCLFYIINIMAADVLATQGARASATMILSLLNRVYSVPAR